MCRLNTVCKPCVCFVCVCVLLEKVFDANYYNMVKHVLDTETKIPCDLIIHCLENVAGIVNALKVVIFYHSQIVSFQFHVHVHVSHPCSFIMKEKAHLHLSYPSTCFWPRISGLCTATIL